MCPFLNSGGRINTALFWSGSTVTTPNGMEIGTGSSQKTVNTSSLVAPAIFRLFTVGTTNTGVSQYVSFQADYNSVELSGLSISEFAVKTSGGNYWSADGLVPIVFDGSIELQIIVSWQCF